MDLQNKGNKGKNALDRLSEALYRNDGVVEKHKPGELHRLSYDAKTDWQHEAVPEVPHHDDDGSSFFKKFFLGSIVFFTVSVVFALVMFYGGGNVVSNEKINLSILGPAYTEGGNEFELQFDIKNGNREKIEYADLILEYPKGASLQGDRDIARQQKFLGEIGAGKSVSERMKLVLFGEEGSERTVKAILEYRVEGSNAIFVKEASYLVHIKSSPLSLAVASLKEVNSNQELRLEVGTLGNAERVVEDILLKVEYPSGFIFAGATPAPSYGNNVWRLGDIDKGTEKKITVRGTLVGEDGEERSFRIYAGTPQERDEQEIGTVYNSFLQTIAIKRPFLETKLSINGEVAREYALSGDGTVQGNIDWMNNLPNRVLDAEIWVKLDGAVLDESSVSAVGGFYNSGSNTITWNKETAFQLGELQGGDGGNFTFAFRLLPLFSANKVNFKNPELILEVGVRGRRVLEDNVPEQIVASERKVIRINSSVQLSPRTLYYTGAFKNTGGLPPKVERETTYTLVWTALNSANDLSKAVVKTKLPTYVRWLDTWAPQGEDVTFNPETREVTWNLGRLDQGAGIESAARQVSLQVGLTPSLSQAGAPVSLTGDIVFEGEDAFTRRGIVFSRTPLTTRLTTDQGVKEGDDIIVK